MIVCRLSRSALSLWQRAEHVVEALDREHAQRKAEILASVWGPISEDHPELTEHDPASVVVDDDGDVII